MCYQLAEYLPTDHSKNKKKKKMKMTSNDPLPKEDDPFEIL